MKKIAVAALALVAAGAAMAEVVSTNIVGYTTKSIAADTFYLCGIQFEEVGNGTGAINLNDLISMSGIEAVGYDDMEDDAAQIQILNASNTGYDFYYYISDAYDSTGSSPVDYDCWADGAGNEAGSVLAIGKGFWFKAPAAAVKGTASIKLKGQVSGNANKNVSFPASTFVLAANPYPIATDFSAVAMSGVTAVGYDDMETDAAQIQALNAANTGYDFYYYISDAYDSTGSAPVDYDCWADGAGNEAAAGAIPVGAGFWIKSPTAGSLTFSR